jgi:hypothetical protein
VTVVQHGDDEDDAYEESSESEDDVVVVDDEEEDEEEEAEAEEGGAGTAAEAEAARTEVPKGKIHLSLTGSLKAAAVAKGGCKVRALHRRWSRR